MEAKEHPLSHIIGQTIYRIPFFQRSYVWNDTNWEALWDELVSPKEDCFLGSIILKAESAMTKDVTYKSVVDGQQRLTTLTILIRALNDHVCGSSGEVDDDYKGYLFYSRSYRDAAGKHEIQKYKLEHSRIDAPVYKEIIDGKYVDILAPEHQDEKYSSNLVRCYRYFRQRLEDASDEEIDRIIAKLTYDSSNILVFIELKEAEDEQAIFDTINSAGVKLTTADIVKNALYQRLLRSPDAPMSEEDANAFYDGTWRSTFEKDDDTLEMWLETKGIGHNVRTNIDLFFHTYAQVKGFFNPAVDKVAELAAAYKDFMNSMSISQIRDFIKEICDYAKTYAETFIGSDKITAYGFDDGKARLLQILNTLRMATFDPVILHAIKTKPVAEQDVLFKKLECYVMRNYILRNSTRSYNIYAIDMMQDKFDFGAALSDPSMSDERVQTALRNIDNKRAGLILFWIELHRHLNPESDLHNAELTYSFEVEHVMPQSWRTNWSIDAVPVIDDAGNVLQGEEAIQARNQAIYEIGNMTLLKSTLNKVLQNDAFVDKVNGRKIGRKVEQGLKAHTAFSITREVINQDPLTWDETKIHARTARLIDEFISVWPCTGI